MGGWALVSNNMLIQETWYILTRKEPVINPMMEKKKSLKSIVQFSIWNLEESFIFQSHYSEYAIFN